ncbi:MAG: hypothetical protein B9S38_02365 [Verrucomicrobiia bacterium Tous-C4TDCM]|nr:MAG: hypothetical protein B9S38_02365 [Verrucomicrobiae bacterium Tous-C4TDCM]
MTTTEQKTDRGLGELLTAILGHRYKAIKAGQEIEPFRVTRAESGRIAEYLRQVPGRPAQEMFGVALLLDEPAALCCPECATTTGLEEILEASFARGILQCPRCQIGSPAREWSNPA